MSPKWLLLFPDARRSNARALVDGPAAFNSMTDAFRTAVNESHFIYILGWMLDDRFKYDYRGLQTTLFDELKRAADAGVELRILVWDNVDPTYSALHSEVVPRLNGLTGTLATVDDYTFSPPASREFIDAQLSPRIRSFLERYARPLLRSDQIGDWSGGLSGSYIVDRLLRFAQEKNVGSHHEKVVLVNGRDGLIGFCGGIDFNRNRISAKVDGKWKAFPRYHDTACRVDGLAAYDILGRFRRRWTQYPRTKGTPLRADALEVPRESGEDSEWVKIVGTYNSPDGNVRDRSLRDAFITAIANAERFIYIEDQYLVSIEVAKAINEKIREPSFGGVIFAIQASDETSDIMIPNKKRGEFLHAVFDGASAEQRKKVLLTLIDKPRVLGLSAWKARRYHPGNHAKTLIVDDELAIIGSANVNRRSFTVDSETSIVVFGDSHPSFAQSFRISLWQHFFGPKTLAASLSNWRALGQILNGVGSSSCQLAVYQQDNQQDLNVRILDSVRGLGAAIVLDEQITVEADGTKSRRIITLTKFNLEGIFENLWEYIIDPNGG